MRRIQILTLCAFAATAAVLSTACSDGSGRPTAPSAVESGTSPPGAGSIAGTPAPTQSAANYEVKFMTGMIDHHQMAIEMADICLQNATHEELRSMCQQVITAQSAEIGELQAWVSDWYGITYEPMMKPGDEKMLERLASLSGAEFEIMFMEMMIQHHEKAIKEAQQCVDKAWHPELRQLCEEIIVAQSAEIVQLRTWLCQWYGRCR